MTPLPTPAETFFTAESAEALAEQLNSEAREEQDGWEYRAKPLGNGRALVQIFDEDGEFVGNL